MKTGIIAGSGKLPVILSQEIKNSGRQAFVISITNDYDRSLISLASDFHQIGIGQVKKIINTLLDSGVKETVIIGKVSKNVLFSPLKFDLTALKILGKLKDKSDSSIFSAVADEIEANGISLIDQRYYLGSLLPQSGILTKHKLTKSQLSDINYGIELARKVSELGIGQTVVIKDQIVLAVEAVEGTDEAIRRGAKLCKGGAIVAKASKSDQDFRFDVPTVGPDTIDILIETKASALAIEYQKAFLIEPKVTIDKANSAKIAIFVY